MSGDICRTDKPGLVQFITFRLYDSMPASRKGEWEHLLAVVERSNAPRERRVKLEDYIDRGLGECFLRDPRIATLMETALRFHHGSRLLLAAGGVLRPPAHPR